MHDDDDDDDDDEKWLEATNLIKSIYKNMVNKSPQFLWHVKQLQTLLEAAGWRRMLKQRW